MQRPWNRVNLPVYSISSKDGLGNSNMNIITYAQAVSMQPKQFVCAIYHATKTLQNVQENPHFVLQILAEDQFRLVDILGKKSGNNINKIERLHKRKLLTQWNGFDVLKESLAVMQMNANDIIHKGNQPDHQLFLCDVIAYKNLHEGNPLTTKILGEKKIIRI